MADVRPPDQSSRHQVSISRGAPDSKRSSISSTDAQQAIENLGKQGKSEHVSKALSSHSFVASMRDFGSSLRSLATRVLHVLLSCLPGLGPKEKSDKALPDEPMGPPAKAPGKVSSVRVSSETTVSLTEVDPTSDPKKSAKLFSKVQDTIRFCKSNAYELQLSDNASKEISALLTAQGGGADLRYKDPVSGKTTLQIITESGHPEILAHVLVFQPELRVAKDEKGSTLLHRVVSAHVDPAIPERATSAQQPTRVDLDIVRSIAEKSTGSRPVDLTATDARGDTPLHTALSFKAENTGSTKKSAVAQAAWELIPSLVPRDSKSGTSPINVQNHDGDTPAHLAVKNGFLTAEGTFFITHHANLHGSAVLQSLLVRGADLSVQNGQKQTPVHCVFELPKGQQKATLLELLRGTPEPVTQGPVSRAERDMQTRRDQVDKQIAKALNTQDENGNTPLHLAIQNGILDQDLLDAFLGAGANPDLQNKDGKTVAHLLLDPACPIKDPQLKAAALKAFVAQSERQADSFPPRESPLEATRDKDGNLPLHLAVKAAAADPAMLPLVSLVKGRSISLVIATQAQDLKALPNQAGQTPLDFAKGNKALIDILMPDQGPVLTDAEVEQYRGTKDFAAMQALQTKEKDYAALRTHYLE